MNTTPNRLQGAADDLGRYFRLAILILATAVLARSAWLVFPTQNGMLGHDYRYFLPYLLAGEQWIRLNGWLSPPHFTAAFCGAMPWLANPQSLTWSLPQLLVLVAEPVHALLATYVIAALAGAAATYGLARHRFALSAEASVLSAVIFMLNSFLFARMAVGHLTYHVYFLVPFIAAAAISRADRLSPRQFCLRSIGGGACIAAMVFGGGLNFVVPAGLSVAATVLVHQARHGIRPAPWLVLAAAGLWSAALSAVKLVAAFVFTLGYPRHYLADGLFAEPGAMLRALFQSLFAPGTNPMIESMGAGRMNLGLHELEFGITVVPLALALTAGALFLRPRQRRIGSPAAVALLALVLLIPAVLTAGSASWARFLSTVPIINNNTMLTRWWSIYMMPFIVLGALGFDAGFRSPQARAAGLGIAAALVMGQTLLRDMTFYTTVNPWGFFDPAAVTAAHRRLANGGRLAPITAVGLPEGERTPDMALNEALLAGDSAVPCYEPVFGYSLEMFPAANLPRGPIRRGADGRFNIADPRCYLGSEGRAPCAPGSPLADSADGEVTALEDYRPVPWRQPLWERAATWSSAASLMVTVGAMAVAAGSALRRRGKRGGADR